MTPLRNPSQYVAKDELEWVHMMHGTLLKQVPSVKTLTLKH